MSPLIQVAEHAYGPAKREFPQFKSGDTIVVYVKIAEGNRAYVQPFEGTVIQRKGKSANAATFTVYTLSGGVGVRRIFSVLDPSIDRIEVKRRGIVRRARLFYLQGRHGKSAVVKSKIGVTP